MIHGFSMALADSVPGVSGGTIAFIMGFYEPLLNALHLLFGKDRALRKDALFYLMKFFVGWGLGMGASILVLSYVFERNIYFMSSLFLGLTVSAIPFILYEERSTLKGSCRHMAFALLGAGLVVLLTVSRTSSVGIAEIRFQDPSILQGGYLLFSGLLAVSAMLLPGISGSTLLLILGVYVPAIHAVKETLLFHTQFLPGLLALAAGAVLGIAFAAKLIRRALRRFRPQMIWLILGLMLGSLYAILMGPAALDIPKPPVGLSSFHAPAFLLGAVLLCGLEWVKRLPAARAFPRKRNVPL